MSQLGHFVLSHLWILGRRRRKKMNKKQSRDFLINITLVGSILTPFCSEYMLFSLHLHCLVLVSSFLSPSYSIHKYYFFDIRRRLMNFAPFNLFIVESFFFSRVWYRYINVVHMKWATLRMNILLGSPWITFATHAIFIQMPIKTYILTSF